MGSVRVRAAFPGSVHEAELCWYDTGRWPAWIDGLAEVVRVEGDWPRVGATVSWNSHPAGRGQVVERVVAFEPLGGQALEVEDPELRGRQSISFTPYDGNVQVELTLDYRLKQRSLVTPVLDLLFIRRAIGSSMRTTLTRFGAELAATRRSGVG